MCTGVHWHWLGPYWLHICFLAAFLVAFLAVLLAAFLAAFASFLAVFLAACLAVCMAAFLVAFLVVFQAFCKPKDRLLQHAIGWGGGFLAIDFFPRSSALCLALPN